MLVGVEPRVELSGVLELLCRSSGTSSRSENGVPMLVLSVSGAKDLEVAETGVLELEFGNRSGALYASWFVVEIKASGDEILFLMDGAGFEEKKEREGAWGIEGLSSFAAPFSFLVNAREIAILTMVNWASKECGESSD